MVFTQNININDVVNNQEFMKICTEHLGCKDCPLKDQDMNIQNSVITCLTGRVKTSK